MILLDFGYLHFLFFGFISIIEFCQYTGLEYGHIVSHIIG